MIQRSKPYGKIDVHGDSLAPTPAPPSDLSRLIRSLFSSDVVFSTVKYVYLLTVSSAHFPPNIHNVGNSAHCPALCCSHLALYLRDHSCSVCGFFLLQWGPQRCRTECKSSLMDGQTLRLLLGFCHS